MAIVVLDVNIIVSGFLRGKGAAVTIASLWEHGELDVAISDHIINQVSKVWEQPYFTRRSDDIDRALAASLMQFAAQKVRPDPSVRGVCDDEEDDLVLGTAVEANAGFLVTGDKGLLRIGEYCGVSIVSAAGFLDVLRDELEVER